MCCCLSRRWRRLARKAESARQARLRHKQFVTDLQGQAAGLQARIRELEAHCAGPGSAAVAIRELKAALKPEQCEHREEQMSRAMNCIECRFCSPAWKAMDWQCPVSGESLKLFWHPLPP